jgi:hypothetical protein
MSGPPPHKANAFALVSLPRAPPTPLTSPLATCSILTLNNNPVSRHNQQTVTLRNRRDIVGDLPRVSSRRSSRSSRRRPRIDRGAGRLPGGCHAGDVFVTLWWVGVDCTTWRPFLIDARLRTDRGSPDERGSIPKRSLSHDGYQAQYAGRAPTGRRTRVREGPCTVKR